jgi:hypothetical protein
VPGLRDGGPAAVHDLHPGTGPPGWHRIRMPGLRSADGRMRPAAVLSGPGRPAAGGHAVRFRDRATAPGPRLEGLAGPGLTDRGGWNGCGWRGLRRLDGQMRETAVQPAGSHQLASPNRCIAPGTSTVRRMNASSATAAASPMPNSAMSREPMNRAAGPTAHGQARVPGTRLTRQKALYWSSMLTGSLE